MWILFGRLADRVMRISLGLGLRRGSRKAISWGVVVMAPVWERVGWGWE